MCRAASGSKCSSLHHSWSCRGDNHMTSLEPRLRGSNPDALLTYSDREQMGSYLQGQKMPTLLSSRPACPYWSFSSCKVILICPGTTSSSHVGISVRTAAFVVPWPLQLPACFCGWGNVTTFNEGVLNGWAPQPQGFLYPVSFLNTSCLNSSPF